MHQPRSIGHGNISVCHYKWCSFQNVKMQKDLCDGLEVRWGFGDRIYSASVHDETFGSVKWVKTVTSIYLNPLHLLNVVQSLRMWLWKKIVASTGSCKTAGLPMRSRTIDLLHHAYQLVTDMADESRLNLETLNSSTHITFSIAQVSGFCISCTRSRILVRCPWIRSLSKYTCHKFQLCEEWQPGFVGTVTEVLIQFTGHSLLFGHQLLWILGLLFCFRHSHITLVIVRPFSYCSLYDSTLQLNS